MPQDLFWQILKTVFNDTKNLLVGADVFIEKIIEDPFIILSFRLIGFVSTLIILTITAFIFKKRIEPNLDRAFEHLIKRELPSPLGFLPKIFPSLFQALKVSLLPLAIILSIYLASLFWGYLKGTASGNALKICGLWLIYRVAECLLKELISLFPPSIYEKDAQWLFTSIKRVISFSFIFFSVILILKSLHYRKDFIEFLWPFYGIMITLMILRILWAKKLILSLLPQIGFTLYQTFIKAFDKYYFHLLILFSVITLLWVSGQARLFRIVLLKLLEVGALALLGIFLYNQAKESLKKFLLPEKGGHWPEIYQAALKIFTLIGVMVLTILVLKIVEVYKPLIQFLAMPIFNLGDEAISILIFIKVVITFIVSVYLSKFVPLFMEEVFLSKTQMDIGARDAISSILRYSLLIIGVMIALEISGIELSTIKIFAGALGVGIGFGLQNIANNLVSGFILLFERSIKRGDLITMADNTWGIVEKIGIRGTIIRTPDNQEIIVPNSQFISSSITNWTFSDKFVRLRIPVGVSYKSDPHLVRKILINVAHTHPKMLTDRGRSPEVLFSEFGESSLNFILLVWVKEPQLEIFRLRSELLFSIFDALKENGIEIPFPQRDIHIRSGLPWERIPGFEEKR